MGFLIGSKSGLQLPAVFYEDLENNNKVSPKIVFRDPTPN